MPKDIRDILKNKEEEAVQLSSNHELRFQQKLQEELHTKPSNKKRYQWLYIAASIVVLLGLGIKFYPTNTLETPAINTIKIVNNNISLGSVSPELKTLENYYTNTINYQLSKLELTTSNKELFEGYLAKIGELTKEYKLLTQELNIKGINDNTINALIGNLQLRLQLLKRMQQQLESLKNLTQNEMQAI